MGLSRIIEYNIRVAFEKFNSYHNLNLSEPSNFDDLLKKIGPYIIEKNKLQALDTVRLISNGLVHSDFEKVYFHTKNAYEIKDIDYYYEKFDPPVVLFQSTITKHGLFVTVTGDDASAKDSKGNKIPLKVLRPDGTNEIDIDFNYFYQTGSFIFTYDVLYTSYKESIVFKEDMKQQVIKSNKPLQPTAKSGG